MGRGGGAVLARLEDRDGGALERRRSDRRSASSARRPFSGSTRSPGWCAPAPPATFLSDGAGSALAQSAAFGLAFVLASLPSCFPWLAFGAVLQRVLRSERARRVFNVVMGALLAASVLLIFW